MPQSSGKTRPSFCQTLDMLHGVAMNPASLSPTLSRLFPAGAVAAELRCPGDPALLLPEEAKYLSRTAVPKRVQEFAAGRLCARRALAEFGIVDFPIEVAGDRQPIWPNSMVGSITHTAGYCAAVVAERGCAGALGLDSEVVGDVKVEVWSSICSPAELIWVRSLAALQQAMAVTLIFSAKEAFYKCQYPLIRDRVGFHDVAVEAPAGYAASGTFRIRAIGNISSAMRAVMPLQGRYLFQEGLVTAGIGWPPQASAQPQ